MSEVKLTRQSEAILQKLLEDVRQHRLTEEELAAVRKGLALMESVGLLGNVIIKAGLIVGALAGMYGVFMNRGSGQ